MLNSLPIKYHMLNAVNGIPVELVGSGTISSGGAMDLHITVDKVPKDWTGVIVPCICSGPGGGPDPVHPGPNGSPDLILGRANTDGLFAMSPKGYRTSRGTLRVATLFDETGQPIAAVRATGVYLRDRNGCDFEIQVHTTTRPDSIISRLASVDSYAFSILPRGRGRVEVHSHYTLSAKDGRKAFGATRIFYDFEGSDFELASPLVGRNDISVDWNGKTLKYLSKQTVVSVDALGRY